MSKYADQATTDLIKAALMSGELSMSTANRGGWNPGLAGVVTDFMFGDPMLQIHADQILAFLDRQYVRGTHRIGR